MDGVDMPEETGTTFAANARLKAEGIFDALGRRYAVLADDSGLAVDALDGAPGVYSARYAGDDATDEENVRKLLRELRGVVDRRARFVASLCVVIPETSEWPRADVRTASAARGDGVLTVFEASGRVEGTIVEIPRGDDGFGYDPVFEPLGWDETLAETAMEHKDAVSHRGAAARELLRMLQGGGWLDDNGR
jgi:XTP/dITP diphosphohydrolase